MSPPLTKYINFNLTTLCLNFVIVSYIVPYSFQSHLIPYSGKTKGGSITVPLTSCLTGVDQSVLQIKTKIVCCHTPDSKPVKLEVTGTVILPPSVFPALLISPWSRVPQDLSIDAASPIYQCCHCPVYVYMRTLYQPSSSPYYIQALGQIP